MGRVKTAEERTTKKLLKSRVQNLEQQVKLLNAVVAQMAREKLELEPVTSAPRSPSTDQMAEPVTSGAV